MPRTMFIEVDFIAKISQENIWIITLIMYTHSKILNIFIIKSYMK